MDSREVCLGGMNWIHLAQGRNRWQALGNTVMNLQVPQKFWEFLECLLASQGLTSMELIYINCRGKGGWL
jgi:hypothetical protein